MQHDLAHSAWVHVMCAFGRHSWIERGTYRRICRYCPRTEVYDVMSGRWYQSW